MAKVPEHERAMRLASLGRPHFPITIETESVDESWSLSGPALIARLTGTVEAIVQLRELGRIADEMILARSLFDYATTFAWLAADTGPDRQRRFARSDACARLKMDDDCRKLGEPVLTPEMRAWEEANRDGLEKNMPDLAQRSEQVDRDWGGKHPLMDEELFPTYRRLYAMMYRHHSGYEHPSALGLNVVAEDQADGTTRIELEQAADDMGDQLMGLVTLLYARSLFIASQTLGWPAEDDVVSEVTD